MQEIEKAFELFDQGNYEQAEKVYLACLERETAEKSESYKAIMQGLGYIKSHQGQFEEAKRYFNEVWKLAIEQEDKKEEAMAVHQLGMVERMAGGFEEALHLFREEAEIWRQYFPEFSVGFSANCYERGYIAFKQKRYEEASDLFQASLEHAKAANSLVAEGCAYRGMGEIELMKQQFGQAAAYFQQACSVFEEAGDYIAAEEVQVFLDQCR